MLLRTLRGPQTRSEQFQLPSRSGAFTQSLTGPVHIDEHQVLTLPTANRCVQLISDTIASLPIHAYRNGNRLDDTPPLLNRLEPGFTRMETMAAIVNSLLLHGNAYALVAERDYLGFARSVVLLSPHAVLVQTSPGGSITYRVAGRAYDADDIIHIRGLTLPGQLVGHGVVAYQRRAVGQSIAAEDYAGERFTTGAIPDGVLMTDAELSPDEASALKSAFVNAHGGRQRTPAVLSGGLRYNPMAWSNVDLEALESRKWNAVTVCQMFGVPPIFAMVPSGESKTYQNVQQDWQALWRGTLRGWMSRIESALTDQLPRGQKAEFNLDAVLRADTKERYEAHAIGLNAGFLTVAEVRELENLNPNVTPPALPAPAPAALNAAPEDQP